MKGEKLNDLKPREVKPIEAERREQGLRFLARMIARVYACDIKVVRKTDREPNSPYCGRGSPTGSSRKPNSRKRFTGEIGGKGDES